MSKSQNITAIDIGSAKIATLIAKYFSEENQIHVIGVSHVPSKGVRKGQIVDIEEAVLAITESVESAERMAGMQALHAYVSIGGSHIASQNSHGVVAVSEPDKEISLGDVARVVQAARAVQLPTSRDILHVLPRDFVVDGQDGIKDPVGMNGVRLEVDTHIITGGLTAIRNLDKCVNEVGLDIASLIFSGLASGLCAVTETEKELGVVLADIGAGTTDICIYYEGALTYSAVLPVGARNITNDLAIGLKVSLESAEKIKIFLSQKSRETKFSGDGKEAKEKDKNRDLKDDEMDISSLNLNEQIKSVSKRTLTEGIIRPRLNEIFAMIGLEIKKSGMGGKTPSGLVITGGGALTAGILSSARRTLAMPVRPGEPSGITGLIDEIIAPQYACPAGLLLYAVRQDQESRGVSRTNSLFPKKIRLDETVKKISDLVKSFLP